MKKHLHSLAAGLLCLTSFAGYAQDDAEVTTLLSADFSIFTEGSPESPVDFTSYGTGSFTSYFTGWSATNAAQAGGALMLKDGGSVRTPYTNMSANGGTIKITFEARALDSYGGVVSAKLGYSTTENVFITDQWDTYELILAGGTSYTTVTLSPMLSFSGILIKSETIEQSPSFIAAPVPYQPNGATPTEFTASWKKVNGATGYFLDVYSYNGNTKEYFLQNEEVATTSYKVTGLDADKQYYFVVRATNGTGVSSDSNEIEVVVAISEIDAPVIEVANAADGNFTLNWQPVANALAYEVSLFSHTTLTETGLTDILSEDFSLVTVGTFESVEFTIGDLDKLTHTPGWDAIKTSLALANGMMVLDKYGDDRYIATPELDLTADDGNCTVTLNLAEALLGTYYTGGKVTVALVTYNEGDEDYTVVSSQELTIDAQEFKEYQVTLTGGTSACRIKVTSDATNANRIFIDDITISQTLPAGSVVRKLVSINRSNEAPYTSTYEPVENIKYSATVCTVGRTVVSGNIVELLSDPSNEVFFGETSGVEAVLATPVDNDAPVEYYDLTGRRINNPATGIYIRRQGSQTTKVSIP
ncbi:MAG: fibronectin type III domain-containing protein [Muribaculaceae bacterium]|nr:fibronectin type III domain-containing protein [Muribaculaceae bacterium]